MKKQSKKLIIECTPKQAMLMELSLDVLSRCASGQLYEIIGGIVTMRKKWYDVKNSNEINRLINLLKKLLFPELADNESYGVGMKEIGDGQIAYEMVKVIQNYRARNLKNPGVLAHAPLHYSGQDLIVIREKE